MAGSHTLGSHTLGPHVVGRRVVVRRVLRGETGPTGGPAMTDVLGTCRSWGRGLCEVEREDGTVVTIHVGDIVSGKPVPPRPSVRLRIPPAALHRHGAAMFPGIEREALGEWALRATPDGQRRRANSALASGDPGLPLVSAAERVQAFYAARDRPALAQVVVGDEAEQALTGLGWERAPGAGGDCLVVVASVAKVLRAAARRHRSGPGPGPGPGVTVVGGRALAEVPEVGRARAVLDGSDASLVGLHDLWVAEPHRRQGVAGAAGALTLEVLEWAASQGATTAYLQVRADDRAAIDLYEGLGFLEHHRYRYLTPGPVATVAG